MHLTGDPHRVVTGHRRLTQTPQTHKLSLWFSHQVVSDSLQPHGLRHQAPLSFTVSRSLPKFMPLESVMRSSHLILCCPLLLLPPTPPSTRVFSSESALHLRWPKYWSFSFSISPSDEHPGLIPFRMDWLDLLAVQGTLKSLLQHHSSEASIRWCSAVFMVCLWSSLMTYNFPFLGACCCFN